MPRFEENEETLRMLLAVAAANERADEGWGQLCRLEEGAVGELEGERQDEVSSLAFSDDLEVGSG